MLHSKQTIVTLIALVLAAALAACGGERPGASPGLDGTEWVLISLNGTSLVEGTNITLTFAEGRVNGFAGCNTYNAAYTSDGSTFTSETPAATEMACSAPAGVMEQEQCYLGFLGDVTVYRIVGSQLRLETGDGRALVFTAQE
jgi:heat shock protein HslJ